MKYIIGIAIAIIASIMAYNTFFGEKNKLTIDETANVVESIRNISEFTTAIFYGETVTEDKKRPEGMLSSLLSDDEIVIITSGTVKAGYKLEKIADKIHFASDTIYIPLPKPEILEVITNPSDNDVFIESGKWSHEQAQKLIAQANKKIEEDAINNGILKIAAANGKYRLEQLFRAFGFNTIIFE